MIEIEGLRLTEKQARAVVKMVMNDVPRPSDAGAILSPSICRALDTKGLVGHTTGRGRSRDRVMFAHASRRARHVAGVLLLAAKLAEKPFQVGKIGGTESLFFATEHEASEWIAAQPDREAVLRGDYYIDVHPGENE